LRSIPSGAVHWMGAQRFLVDLEILTMHDDEKS
jgi:hypothetical protein